MNPHVESVYASISEKYRAFQLSLLNTLFTTNDMIENYDYSYVLLNNNSFFHLIYDITIGNKNFLFLKDKQEGLDLINYSFNDARNILEIDENSTFKDLCDQYEKFVSQPIHHLIIDKKTFIRLVHHLRDNLSDLETISSINPNKVVFLDNNFIDGKEIQTNIESKLQKSIANFFITQFSESSNLNTQRPAISSYTDLVFPFGSSDDDSNTNKLQLLSLSSSLSKIKEDFINKFLNNIPTSVDDAVSPEVERFYRLANRTNKLFFKKIIDTYFTMKDNNKDTTYFSPYLMFCEAPFAVDDKRLCQSLAELIKESKYSTKQINFLKKEVFFQPFKLSGITNERFIEYFQNLRDLDFFTENEISQHIFSFLKDIYKLKNQKIVKINKDIFSYALLDSCTDNELKIINKLNEGLTQPLPIISKVVEKLFSSDESFVKKYTLNLDIFPTEIKERLILLVNVDNLSKFFPTDHPERVVSSILKNLADSLHMPYEAFNIPSTKNMPKHLHNIFTFSENTHSLPFKVDELFLREKLLILAEKTFSSGISDKPFKDIFNFHSTISHELVLNLILESKKSDESTNDNSNHVTVRKKI